MSVRLRGMTWSHPRGYDPMVATGIAWREKTGVEIAWDKRSLQDFESFPVNELARQYDLIVIDHPHVGQVTAENCLVPLDVPGREREREELAANSIGPSYPSYNWQGRQWALPIDAAAQVMAYRPDRLDTPPADWPEVIACAKAGEVVVPMLPPHSLMTFCTLAANLGSPCATEGEELISAAAGALVCEHLFELTALIAQSNFAMDPIAALETLSRADAIVSVMPYGYGYVSYARPGFRPHPLRFVDIPSAGAAGPAGSAIGGTGIAVSAFSAHQQDALDYAYWVASGEVQRTLYVQAGGQPAHASAWGDAEVNAATSGFFANTRATLDASWLRPRHRGYMGFQDTASKRLNHGLLTREPAAAIVGALNQLFRESF